jgi:hypothetical protein
MLYTNVSQREFVDLFKPKVESARIGIAPEIAEVFHQDERPAVFSVNEPLMVGNFSENRRPSVISSIIEWSERLLQ